MENLSGKNIIIMGGTSGMGLAAAKAFVECGAKLVVIGKSDQDKTIASEVLGSDTCILTASATNPESIHLAIDHFTKKSEVVHGLFHVAGGSGRSFGDGPLHELSLEGWNKTIELNLTSTMLSNQAVVIHFLKNKVNGSILNMGSVLGSSPSPKYFSTHAYATAKSAIEGFSKSVASYYASNNIRVNVLAPSLYTTPMAIRAIEDEQILNFVKSKQPLDWGRAGLPADITGAACYFMSDASRFTTGQVLSIDGGWRLTDGQYS